MAVTPTTALKAAANAAAAAAAEGSKNAAFCSAISSGIGSGYKLVARRNGVVVLDMTMAGSLSSVTGGLAIPTSYSALNTLLDADIDTGSWTMRVEKASDASVYLEGTLGRTGTDFILSGDLAANGDVAFGSQIVLRSPAIDARSIRWNPGHYMVTSNDMNHTGMMESRRNLVKTNPYFAGYKNIYWWGPLEPTKNGYDFSMVTDDLDKAQADGKMMLVELWAVSFHGYSRGDPLPAYISSEYNGSFSSVGDENIVAFKYWDADVAERFYLFVEALLTAIDSHPAFEGICYQECSIQGAWQQPGWTFQKHYDFWLNLAARAQAKLSHGQQNFSVAWGLSASTTPTSKQFTDAVVNTYRCGVGVADCRISGSTGSQNVYGKHIWTDYRGKSALLAGIEWDTYAMGWTATQLINYGVDTLGLTHMHWQDRDSGGTFNISQAIAAVTAQSGRINTAKPSNLV